MLGTKGPGYRPSASAVTAAADRLARTAEHRHCHQHSGARTAADHARHQRRPCERGGWALRHGFSPPRENVQPRPWHQGTSLDETLPCRTVAADLKIGYALGGAEPSQPSVALDDITVDLGGPRRRARPNDRADHEAVQRNAIQTNPRRLARAGPDPERRRPLASFPGKNCSTRSPDGGGRNDQRPRPRRRVFRDTGTIRLT